MRTMAIALAVCLTASTLPAAEPTPFGARVRALGPDGLKIEGALIAYSAQDLTITVTEGGKATSVGLHRIERLQIADGRERGAGFMIGLLAGAAVAVGVGLLSSLQGDHCGDAGGEECPAYGYLLGFITVPVGAFVGTAFAPVRWREVQLPSPVEPGALGLRLQVAPVRGGARFALTYGF